MSKIITIVIALLLLHEGNYWYGGILLASSLIGYFLDKLLDGMFDN